ncbi:TetR/AcrR family transcriptional regulator C-terminal domain-containing protein [Kutzneria viridogrisea]|uniref:HTH tetR-type domain-containing protein n=2 Tax=Kutzneria TaxID=43356 RepID=W5WI12_9PSEU|nr:TetR/AcrR family transcriptional regulator [Kutzneria albida]AHH97799.1 hypothetical protein KALB_4437 [Kutzneria albida DSM 43870]MBA8924614.1 AcrR family transcriptional regulator [Kutzneria viridogrisea]
MPQSRRDRPAKPALSRAGIVAVAVDLLHSEGLDRVTMRRLSAELDTGPASLYVYVRNTADLHAAVLDELLGTVDLAPDSTADWQDRLVQVLASYTRVLFQHPGLARTAMLTWPSGPHYLALLEQLLGLLAEGGVPTDRAAWAVDLLMQLATATAAEHSTREETKTGAEFEALRAAAQGADRRTHPHLTAAGAELFSGAGPDRLLWGLRVLINGVLATPRPE